MSALVWFYIGCLAGITVYLLVAEAIPYWRGSNTLQEQQIRDALEPGDFKRWEGEE
jgi:hypothetical protein